MGGDILMKKVSTATLRELEVINVCGGERLGYPFDFEIDLDTGKILSLIVPACGAFQLFGKKEEVIIPWSNIECIGEDAILVKISQNERSSYSCASKNDKRRGFFR